MNSNLSNKDLTQITISVLIILMLIIGSAWIFEPFIAATLWAGVIVISTYNFMLKLQKLLWNKRGLAITVMLLLFAGIVLVPILIIAGAFISNASEISGWLSSLKDFKFQEPPEWFASVPFVGSQLQSGWNELAGMENDSLMKKAAPLLGDLLQWLIAKAGNFGAFLISFLITVIICGILYSKGETAVKGLKLFALRLIGKRGDEIIVLAGQAVKAITMGVVLTALIQSILGGIGLAVAGVPRAGLLTAVMFILGLVQIGAAPVLIPVVIWKYSSGDPVWGTVLLVWSIVVLLSDNVIRPVLIKRGADLPIILIFAGVIGGLIAFGIVGLFIGPVILAVAYTLLKNWVNEKEALLEQPETKLPGTTIPGQMPPG